jgi:RNA polymerase sigma factor (sigma-70 family)
MRISDAPSTRASFLNQLKDTNDQRMWALFTETYQPVIERWCRGQGLQEADADDVCARVMLKVWNKIREFHYDPSGRFRGWLRTIVANEVHDFFRGLRRRPDARGSGNASVHAALEQVEALPNVESLQQDLDELEAEQERLREAMHRVEARVEPHTWQAWLRTVQQGLPAKEVSEQLGISTVYVYKAKQRINEMIRVEYLAAGGRHGGPGSEKQK